MSFSTRAIMAGLLGFGLVAGAPATAEARSEARPAAQAPRATAPGAQMARREAAPARPSAARPAAAAQAPRGASAVPYATARGAANPAATGGQRLAQTAMANCVVRNGRRVCQAQPRNTAFRWTGGLAPAALSQTSCPDGTIATTAIGHSNVVRCMPL
jgi:hypothetical protein